MSAQSGIKPTPELVSAFQDAVLSKSIRAIKVCVNSEQECLTLKATLPRKSSFEADFNDIHPLLEPKIPCLILFCKDDEEWLVLQWVPEDSKVRDKMLISASKASLTKALGDSKFVDSIFGTNKSEISLDGYKSHVLLKSVKAPLTDRELELAALKKAESQTDVGTTTRKAHMIGSGVSFPLTPKAETTIDDFTSELLQLVVLSLDIEKEVIDVDLTKESVLIDQVSGFITKESPRFVVYRVNHDSKSAIVFAMTCPYAAKVRERMLYSSSRGGLLNYLESEKKLVFAKKFEFDEPDNFNATEILDPAMFAETESTDSTSPQSTPKLNTGLKFAKPTRPGQKRK